MGYVFCAFVMGFGEGAERCADDFAYIGFNHRDGDPSAEGGEHPLLGVCLPAAAGFRVPVHLPAQRRRRGCRTFLRDQLVLLSLRVESPAGGTVCAGATAAEVRQPPQVFQQQLLPERGRGTHAPDPLCARGRGRPALQPVAAREIRRQLAETQTAARHHQHERLLRDAALPGGAAGTRGALLRLRPAGRLRENGPLVRRLQERPLPTTRQPRPDDQHGGK